MPVRRSAKHDTARHDFKTADRAVYSGKAGRWDLIEVPPMRFLMIGGEGDPDGPAYARALSALYPLAYAIKFASKAEGLDFVVPPLEALWWADDPTAFVRAERSQWRWTAMLRMPTNVTESKLEAAKRGRLSKPAKGQATDAAVLAQVRLDNLAEGLCLQTLHIGPYAAEAPVLADLHDRVMREKRLTFAGPHHEVYLSDPRRVAPDKLRTLLRQPVRPQ